MAPTLETERLILRHYRKEDFRSHYAIVADPETMKYFTGPPMAVEESWRRMSASVGSWSLMGFGGWAVVQKSNERLIGMTALFNGWRDMIPEFGEDPEMGWIFDKSVHGQGIAGEACRAALGWADENLPPTPVWAIVAPDNAPSLKLADRLGFERLADSVYKDEVTAVFRRPRRA